MSADSEEVEFSYQLLNDLWSDAVSNGNPSLAPDTQCWSGLDFFFRGLIPDDELYFINESGYPEIDWDRVGELQNEKNIWHDPEYMKQTWVAMLVYFMMDHKYLMLH